MTIHLLRSVSVVTHKLIELNKTCMAAILKARSTVTNENRRNKVFTVIKQLTVRDYSKDTYFSLNYYIHVIFISTFPRSLKQHTTHTNRITLYGIPPFHGGVIISIFHGCMVWIEKSVTRVTDRHHEACRVMPNSDPE